ncbi:MAG: Chemotaxis response regulator protein-glutamate methylesterase [Phycisphaerae bacterium]|nr:Chemotaxis response regulator protein-glutamate methylesterase [Phycisphaerae bacterium]
MKEVFTTGEAAEVCQVSQQTIIRCFDAGRIKGFRVPGSRFRRIPRDALIQFMRDNDIPLDRLSSGKSRVLVVDDDPEIVDIFTDALKRDGRFEIRTAQTGYDAGIATQEFNPDLLILDYMLPDINGNIVCRTIRQNPAFAHMKIVFVSGVVDRHEIEDLLRAGADDFVKKPFNVRELIDKIAGMLKMESVQVR